MFFWKIDDETIRCLINKEEITSMGFEPDHISEDREAMASFLDAIVQNSREYIDWHTENGIQNYMAKALPADQYLITISCTFEDEIIDRNVAQIRRMTNNLNEFITEDRLKRIEALFGDDKEKAFAALARDLNTVCNGGVPEKEAEDQLVLDGQGRQEPAHEGKAQAKEAGQAGGGQDGPDGSDGPDHEQLPGRRISFRSFDKLLAFSGMLESRLYFRSSLYKFEEEYVLFVDFEGCKKDADAISLILTAEEFGGECAPVYYDDAYMLEHGKPIIREEAIRALSLL